MHELKHLYIEKLRRKYELSERDYDVLYKFSHNFDDELRWEAAELLCDHYTPKAVRGGLLRASDKYQSGILYGLEDVDYVYQIIMSLKKDM